MKDRRQDCYFLLQAIGELSEETVSEAKRGRVFPLRRIAIAAAAIIVIAGLLTGVIYVGLTDIPTATVTLDLSYGVTLRLNRDNKIVACNASTPQSAQKVKDLGLMMTEAPEAIGKIVGSMIDDGDLNSYDNTLLLTSSGCDLSALRDAVEQVYIAEDFSGALLCQQIDSDSRAPSGEKNITGGKAELIRQLAAHADDLDEETLSGLSVTNLCRIALSRGITLDGVALTGEPAPAQVSRDNAVEIALRFLVERGNQAAVTEAVLTSDGKAVYYHIRLSGPHTRYIISVDSVSGRVLTYSEIPDPPADSAPTATSSADSTANADPKATAPTTVIEYELPAETAAVTDAAAKTSPTRTSSGKTLPTYAPKKPTEPPADPAKRYITGVPYMNTTFTGEAIGYDMMCNCSAQKGSETRNRLALVDNLDQMWDFLTPYDYSSTTAEWIQNFFERQSACADYRYLVIVQLCDNEKMVIFNRVVRNGVSLCPEISYEERDYETEGTWEKYSLQIIAIPASYVEGVTRFY